jgi:hypothetical protein
MVGSLCCLCAGTDFKYNDLDHNKWFDEWKETKEKHDTFVKLVEATVDAKFEETGGDDQELSSLIEPMQEKVDDAGLNMTVITRGLSYIIRLLVKRGKKYAIATDEETGYVDTIGQL